MMERLFKKAYLLISDDKWIVSFGPLKNIFIDFSSQKVRMNSDCYVTFNILLALHNFLIKVKY